jgi:hypothetical protein
MPSRAQLNLRARVVGLDPATIQNDSVLEQRVIKLEKEATTVTGASATTTLTSTGVAGNNETFTIGTRVYTLKTALTAGGAVADEILIGAAATNTLDNIKDAINRTSVSGAPGTTYGSGTTVNEQVSAGAKNATTLVLTALFPSLGNTIVTTETMANFAFTGGTLASGLPKVVASVAADVAAVAGGQVI